jgi:hypothetical protein
MGARFVKRLIGLGLALLLVVGIYVLAVSSRYGVGIPDAATSVIKQMSVVALRGAVFVYDPYRPLLAQTGPDGTLARLSSSARLEDVLPIGRPTTAGQDFEVTVIEIANERIVRSRFNFGYQPYDESALQELRRKYKLDEVVAEASNDFEAMVLLRNWARSRFRRGDYQRVMENFNALDLLTRDEHIYGEPYTSDSYYDPCHFFPLLYSQLVVSLGYQARLVSVEHGMAEVWSNHFRKWIVMDAELNLHYEKKGVPLNMAEMLDEYHAPRPAEVEVVRGEQTSGDANTTMVHLGLEHLPVETALKWFDIPLDIVDMRNDWMTNHYFRGHPNRSETNSPVYVDPKAKQPIALRQRLRPVTTDRRDFYWSLNQTEILAKRPTESVLELTFDTFTPNFDHFEIRVNGSLHTQSDPVFAWHLVDGTNMIAVRSVNKFGVGGITSGATVTARKTGQRVQRRHHPYRHVAARIHAAPGRPGAPPALTSNPLPWRARAERKAAS